MNMHKNARLTPRGRERIVRQVESGQTIAISPMLLATADEVVEQRNYRAVSYLFAQPRGAFILRISCA
jgi:hypothetical protein